jgi:ATP-dependent Lhr-like helicase
VAEVVRKLAGFEIPTAAWEASVLPARVQGYRQEWTDQLTLTGEVVWGRLWGAGNTPIRTTPVCLVPREDLETWLALSDAAADRAATENALTTYARTILDALRARGACFTQELERLSRLLPSHFEMGLTQLIAHGLVSCDSFGGLRRLITSPSRRRGVARRAPLTPAGRWSLFRGGSAIDIRPIGATEVEFVARQLLTRYGVVFKRLLERERMPVPWRDLVRVYRTMEMRGDVRGGRFVQRFSGEQYALPEAVELMRRLRRRERAAPSLADPSGMPRGLHVSAADPLNLEGILTPEARVPAQARRRVVVASAT